jgi:CAAX prenyl protease-like protein
VTAETTPPQPPHSSQFALLGERRFAPFFWTQFFGAANDNLFKFAFTVLVTYQLSVSWLPPAQAGLAIGALFVLPYLLFSATAGQLADKFEKTTLIRLVKNLEIGIMALAAWGFMAGHVPLLLGCIFLLGLHSTLFGPVKFAYLPQHLSERELTGGNGMVEMGTFVAILLGNVVGGLLIALPGVGARQVAIACFALALTGRAAAQFVPRSPATDPGLTISWNPASETWRNLKLAHGNLVVFRTLLGISWLWFFGSVFLSNFPAFARDVLHGDEQVASLLLVVFSLGIGIGSLLCETLSRRHVEIGLVPLGAIGMTVFAIDLYLASRALPAPAAPYTVAQFVAVPAHWRLMTDLALMCLSAGLFSVPMYALMQLRTPATHRARIIAANNILNALFMIGAALIAGALLGAGLTVPQLFLAVGLANALVAGYIFLLVPEYLLRFIAWIASRIVYRFRVSGDEHIPTEGAAILVANHVSFVDAVLLMAASPRPIRFIMDHKIFRVPVLGWMFKLAKAIPIAPQKVDARIYERAFAEARRVLDEGDLLCIFPEGGITQDGTLQPFKGGIMKILETHPVPVVPLALTHLWGSFFSRIEGGRAMARPFRRGMFNRVGLIGGAPIAAAQVTPEALHARVGELLAHAGCGATAVALSLSRDAVVRIAPFAVFMLLLVLRGAAPADGSWGLDPRWLYGASVLACGALLAGFWREYGELARQTWPDLRELALAAAVGLAVSVLWIHLDAPWMTIGEPSAPFAPLAADGSLDRPLVAVRWIGAAILVPLIEELFWRSFLMRWIERPTFQGIDPRTVGVRAVVLSSFVFTLAHTLWLAAAIAGLAYALLYVRTGKLWVPVIAHAVTNGVLGVWVVATGNWRFW